ncbi:MAG: hypothetical protein IKQ20_07310 [Bacteroidales bacterium]|nr:hypothetical protein [Bacteroidales bacterium]
MKRCFLLAFLFFITTACHHKDKQQTADSVSTPADTTIINVDTTSILSSDTAQMTTKPFQLQLQEDSFEITHLKIFARKQQTIYAPSLLVGEWLRGTEHEEYFANGTGRMWNTAEDVTRDEAQRFQWTLDSNLLTITCRLELGGIVPKRYVVTYADDENLAYNDHHGTAYLWDKKK